MGFNISFELTSGDLNTIATVASILGTIAGIQVTSFVAAPSDDNEDDTSDAVESTSD